MRSQDFWYTEPTIDPYWRNIVCRLAGSDAWIRVEVDMFEPIERISRFIDDMRAAAQIFHETGVLPPEHIIT